MRIDFFVVSVGVLLAVAGLISIWSGSGFVQVERGWTEVIAGSVALSGGLAIVALGLILRRLGALLARLDAGARPSAAPSQAPMIQPPPPSFDTAAPKPSARGMEVQEARTPPRPEPAARPPLEAPKAEAQTPVSPAEAQTSPWDEPASASAGYPRRPKMPIVTPPAETPRAPSETPAAGSQSEETRRRADAPAFRPDVPRWEVWPRNAGGERRGDENPAPTQGGASRTRIDDWLERAATGDDETPARSPAQSSSPPSAAPAQHGGEIVGQYDANGAHYLLFADGSIEAQTTHGVYHFASMEELKLFIEGKS